MGEDSFLQSRVFNIQEDTGSVHTTYADLNRNSKYTTQSTASSEGEELTEGKDLTGRPVRSMCRLI